MSITADAQFAPDSSLEGNGFKLSVPHEIGHGFQPSSAPVRPPQNRAALRVRA